MHTQMASDEGKTARNNGNRESSTDDDWERMIDNGSLDRAIERLSMKNSSKGGPIAADKDLSEPSKVQVRLEEPPTRTQFTPMVRILKRETKPKSGSNDIQPNNTPNGPPPQKTPPTTKTFAQRQDEYARARARIMGNQGTANSTIPNGQVRTTLLDIPNNRHPNGQSQFHSHHHQPQPQHHHQQQQQQQLLQQQQQQQQQQFYKERRPYGR